VAQPAKRPATYADIEALPANLVGEILFGVLHAHPRPAAPHARASSTIGELLGDPFNRGRGGPGGWIILDEPELHLGADVVVPDLAGWRRERMPTLPDAAYFTLATDWMCEVVSASTKAIDHSDKMDIYLRERVKHVWLVDPIARTLEVFRRDDERFYVVKVWRDDAVVRAEPFDAIEIALADLWQR
jgi:Uma2 family endonuclease